LAQSGPMDGASTHLRTWVAHETKQRFAMLARELGLSESALLKRSVRLMLSSTVAASPVTSEPVEQVTRGTRLYVRLRREDHLLLRERAAGREMATATYVSILLRAHLRNLRPLPDRELAELKRSVAELGVIGRNLNQIARLANQTGKVEGPNTSDLHALLRALGGLRDHMKGLIRANSESWETGNAEAPTR
jgi:hypothetical protein